MDKIVCYYRPTPTVWRLDQQLWPLDDVPSHEKNIRRQSKLTNPLNLLHELLLLGDAYVTRGKLQIRLQALSKWGTRPYAEN